MGRTELSETFKYPGIFEDYISKGVHMQKPQLFRFWKNKKYISNGQNKKGGIWKTSEVSIFLFCNLSSFCNVFSFIWISHVDFVTIVKTDTVRFFIWWFPIQCWALQKATQNYPKMKEENAWLIKTISLNDFPMYFQRVPKSARPWRRTMQGSENFLTLEGTNVFEAVQSFLPLFATFRESQSIQENQLLNVTVRALCHHSCHVTVFCRSAPWVWNQSRHRVWMNCKKPKYFKIWETG